MVTLPVDGQLNWGDELNAGINTVESETVSAQTALNNHEANIPSDPHGDRAYTNSLVNPITSGTNLPNGYVKLNSSGVIPAALITGLNGAGGMYASVFDAVDTYGMTPGSVDCSAQLQNALNAANSAGGGVVWVGPGLFSLANYVVIGNNTWLMLSEGTTLSRVTGVSNPPYLVSNVQFGTSNTPSSGFMISGGSFDAVGTGGLSSACTPIFMIQASNVRIRDTQINCVFNNPGIEINGCTAVYVNNTRIGGPGSTLVQPTVPAIRINTSASSTTPSGLASGVYNNTTCHGVNITDCHTQTTGSTFGNNGNLAASDLLSGFNSVRILVTGCSTTYSSNNNAPVVTTQWSSWTVSNCLFSEFSGNDGWKTPALQHSWANSGQGPNCQYRVLQGIPNTVEVIGDVTAGTLTDNTQVFSIPFSLNSAQIIHVDTPGSSVGGLYLKCTTGGSINCFSFSGLPGIRVFFHAFISIDA